jgi:hypothetical protein
MRKQGAIILGSGGDCCKPDGGANLSAGTFYEGAMVAGYPSDATENAVQANVIAAGYSTGGGNPGTTGPIRGLGSGRCLDSNGTATGTQLQILDCANGANQTWTRTASGQLTVHSGDNTRCAGARNNQTGNGTAVVIAPCDGGAGQKWQLNANGTITGTQSGLCLDVNGAATGNGSKIILWTCHGGSNQQWSFG